MLIVLTVVNFCIYRDGGDASRVTSDGICLNLGRKKGMLNWSANIEKGIEKNIEKLTGNELRHRGAKLG
jgi:hypothetical protein